MQYHFLRPMLYTHQFQETISFYCNLLGFTVANLNEEWGWAALRKDGIEIMLARPNEHIPFDKPQFTGSFYINTDDVNGIWEKLKDKVNIVYPIYDTDWEMREFAIYDNNGYVIQFGQDLEEVGSD